MLYLQKYLTNLQKRFFARKKRKMAIVVENLLCTDIWVCNSNVTTFQTGENVQISIFPFKLSREKCYIFKSILRIFKNILFAERWQIWLLFLKISCAQIFWFSNSNVTTFPKSRKCKNFNFSLYTIPAERWGMWLENLLCTDILCYIFKSIFTNFQFSKCGYCGWKFLVHRDFGFAIATLQHFQNPENAERWGKVAIGGWKFLVHRYFGFAIATLQLSKIQKI